MNNYFNSILNVTTPDPDEARRGRVLNILLLGTFSATIIGLIAIVAGTTSNEEFRQTETIRLLAGTVITALGLMGIFLINKRWSRSWAALFFLLLLTVIFTFSDSAEELSNGRSLFIFMLPIAISSLILLPQASFLFATISSCIVAWLTYTIGGSLNVFAIIGFFMLALVSWLSARSLESALKDLRVINANLDQLVIQRTQALAESLQRERIEAGRNQAILNSIADGVIVFDTEWNATLANPAIQSMLELPVDTIMSNNFRDLLKNPSLSEQGRKLLQAMIERDTQPFSFRVGWGKKTLSVSAAQVFDRREEGHVNIGTVTVFRDFTHEAEIERLKSTFVAIVSHELRTPLNAILGYAEMFKESVYGPMNEKQTNTADRIIKNTQRLLGLINDLLDQAQMEAGRLTINISAVKPAELLENVHGVLDKIAADKSLKLSSNIHRTLPEILMADSARVQQILVNLGNNAIKFTDKGGVNIRLFRPDQYHWGIEVADTGRGIARDELPYIFETFRQVEGTTTRTRGGFGLGLAIVKQLVNLMNGEIRVKSELNKGTTFTIHLPLSIP